MVWLRNFHDPAWSPFKVEKYFFFKILFRGLLLSCLFVLKAWSQDFDSSLTFEVKKIQVQNQKINVAIADDDQKRTQGLMFVKDWSKYKGMLFVFDKAEKRSFWMKNTLLPLSIGFFDESKKLIEVKDMSPAKSLAQVTFDRSKSSLPARYALEVPKGWFQKNKIKVGARLNGL